MEIAELLAQENAFVFPRFDDAMAWDLGSSLALMALIDRLAVVINIRTPNRVLFHAALPGSTPSHETSARRKSATALHMHEASLLTGTKNRARGIRMDHYGLDPIHHADAGGAVPLRVAGVGVVAVVTVSGLTQAEDHAMVCRALAEFLARPE